MKGHSDHRSELAVFLDSEKILLYFGKEQVQLSSSLSRLLSFLIVEGHEPVMASPLGSKVGHRRRGEILSWHIQGYGVMAAHEALTLTVEVRFFLSLPDAGPRPDELSAVMRFASERWTMAAENCRGRELHDGQSLTRYWGGVII